MEEFILEVFKKIIILSPASCDGKSEEKGILTLQKEVGKVKGVLKCFHLNEYEGKLLMGLTFEDNVLHKFNIEQESTALFSFNLPQDVNLAGNISCVLVNMDKSNNSPIIWGSTEVNKVSKLEVLQNMIDTSTPVKKHSVEEEISKQYIKKPIEIIEQQFLDDEEVEHLIDDEFEKFENEEKQQQVKKQLNDWVPYKEVFQTKKNIEAYSNVKKTQEEMDEDSSKEDQETQNKDWFYDEVKDQIDALFSKYEREEALEEIIPNARFVRVNFEEGAESYIFGIIYDENKNPEYIVYGIPAVSSKKAPQQLEGYYQWLPLDPEKPEEDGYFLMYQDAKSGEHVKIEII